ncbi:MAG TPA: ABC transporter substrate-binding protein [Candidatus Dormibacteraeota bacterium]|nr:ABC transporter substrate-binding protein [Candidatus Dormibacteraeota bacterium]
MRSFKFQAFLMTILGLSLIASACGTSGGGSPSTTTKETLTFAGFNFSESTILMDIYGKALEAKGYKINYKANLGSREVVEPALASGQIDFYPGYAATDLEFINKGKGEATGDPQATTAKLNTYLSAIGAKALDPSPALDANAFAVTKATAAKYSLTKLSDLAPVAGRMVLGGPPECATRPYCQPGLKSVYGANFKDFKALDADGPLTRAALSGGQVDIALVFSSDGDLDSRGYVVLDDDKHLEAADNVVPIIRTKVLNSEITSIFNKISAALNTTDLRAMNKSAGIDHVDPDTLAATWLKQHGFTS